jgi:hypothetical protein
MSVALYVQHTEVSDVDLLQQRGVPLKTEYLRLPALVATLLLGACASTQQVTTTVRTLAHKAAHPERYTGSPADVPPNLSIEASDERLDAVVDHWIVPEGPGTWVRDAKWDEVVLTLANKTASPIAVTAVLLVDPRGEAIASGDDPPEIESRTDRLIGEYEDVGFSVAIVAAPVAVYGAAALATSAAVGAGLATGTAATGLAAGAVATGGVGVVGVGVGAGSAAVVGAPILVPAAIVAAPVYYFWRKFKKEDDLERITSELRYRQLSYELGPRNQVHGSQFFPIVPNPRALAIEYTVGEKSHTLEIPLSELDGLHVGKPIEERRKTK